MNRVEGTTAEGTTALQHYSREAQSFAGANQSQSFIGANQSFKPPFTMRQFSRSGEAYMLTNSAPHAPRRATARRRGRVFPLIVGDCLSLVHAGQWGWGPTQGIAAAGVAQGLQNPIPPLGRRVLQSGLD